MQLPLPLLNDGREGSGYLTIIVLALDEVPDNLFLVQCIWVTEDMKCCCSPIESVDPEMLREPVLEVVFFLRPI